MTTYKIPAGNWHIALADAIKVAEPGDTVIVRTEPMLRLAEIAAGRMGKEGVILTMAEMHPDEYTPAAAIALERARIQAERPACTTAPDMTGARCTCATDCRNYWLRAKGLAGE